MADSSIISREELVVGAKLLKEVADRAISGCSANTAEIIRLLEAESEILQSFITTFGTSVILIEFIHSRLEYFMFLFLYVIENYDQTIDHSLSSISSLIEHCMSYMFLCLEQPERADGRDTEVDDLHSLTTNSAVVANASKIPQDNCVIPSRQWYNMFLASSSCIAVEAFAKLPGILLQPSFGLQRAMGWSKSEHWQVQQIGIAAIRALLVLDYHRIDRLQKEAIMLAAKMTAESLQLKTNATSSSMKRSVASTNKLSQSVSSNSMKIPPSRQSSVKEVSTDRRSSQKSASRASTLMSASAGNLKKTESFLSRKLPQQKQQTIDAGVAEEICRNGFIRSIVWMLFHRQGCIRLLAANALRFIVSVAQAVDDANDFQKANSNTANNSNNTVDCKFQNNENCCSLWAAAFEQGIISLLECAATGFTIQSPLQEHQNDSEYRHFIFPELIVRQSAQAAQSAIQRHTEKWGGVRLRILSALTHSGHPKLRLNILSGIFFICGRSSKLGQQLWEGVQASPSRSVVSISFPIGGQHFAALCSSLLQDVHDFNQVSTLLMHFVDTAIDVQRHQRQLSTSHEIATQAGGGAHHASDLDPFQALAAKMKEQVLPTVLIGFFSTPGTNWVKMVCPPLHKIKKSSSLLGEDIERYHALQIEESMQLFIQVNIDPTQSKREQFELFGMSLIEKQVKALMQKLDDQYFHHIEGSYESWQELFSHMGDDTIRHASTNKMNLQQITECLVLASRISAERLVDKYVSTLIQRLSSSTIVPIFRAAVCEFMPTTGNSGASDMQVAEEKMVHLVLVRACLQYLRSEWDFCVRRKEGKEMNEIFQCLCTFTRVSIGE